MGICKASYVKGPSEECWFTSPRLGRGRSFKNYFLRKPWYCLWRSFKKFFLNIRGYGSEWFAKKTWLCLKRRSEICCLNKSALVDNNSQNIPGKSTFDALQILWKGYLKIFNFSSKDHLMNLLKNLKTKKLSFKNSRLSLWSIVEKGSLISTTIALKILLKNNPLKIHDYSSLKHSLKHHNYG